MFFFVCIKRKTCFFNDTTLMLFLKPSHHWCFCKHCVGLGSALRRTWKRALIPLPEAKVGGCNFHGVTRCVLYVWYRSFWLIYRVFCACLYGFYNWQIYFFSWNTCNIKMIWLIWQNSRWISLRNSQHDITVIRKIVINKPEYPILIMLALFRWGHVPS